MSVSETTLKALKWSRLGLKKSEANLEILLKCGQTFRWTKIEHDDNYWVIGMEGRGIVLRQVGDVLNFAEVRDTKAGGGLLAKKEPLSSKSRLDRPVRSTEAILKDYFNLDTDINELYTDWSSKDAHFRRKGIQYMGIRVLRQDPWENLCSFICSSNNNVKRISQMVKRMTDTFGDHVATLDSLKIHDFPPPERLVDTEPQLREMGLGYRAKYISRTAEMMVERCQDKPDYLEGLRTQSFDTAKTEIMEFLGVGPKVADCVCLFSLDKHDTVPVDTHVWQIAQRDYGVAKSAKTMTPKAYALVQDYFREKWGPYAGWAHCVLFAANLRDFNDPNWEQKERDKRAKGGSGAAVKSEELDGLSRETTVVETTTVVAGGAKVEVKEEEFGIKEEVFDTETLVEEPIKRELDVSVHRTRSKRVKR